MRGIYGTLILSLAVARSRTLARLFGRIFNARQAFKSVHAFGNHRGCRQKRPRPNQSCHSERSEAESKNLCSCPPWRLCLKHRDASTSLSMRMLAVLWETAHERAAGSDQSTFAEVAKIAARGTFDQVDGELEQANFPGVIYAVNDRAERFVFAFDFAPGAIDHCVN